MSERRRVAIVMSRLRRLIDPHDVWLCGLRAALRRLQESGDELFVVSGTAGCEFIQQGASRLQIPIEVRTNTFAPAAPSPEGQPAIPEQDRLLVSTPDLVLALAIRPNGHVHQALQQRLADGGAVELIDLPRLCPPAVREDLLRRGTVLWSPSVSAQRPLATLTTRPADRPTVCEIAPQPPADSWVFLTHTTRACSGPWPGQSQADYIDGILDNSADADHSPLAALERIVAQRKLLAASRMIRGGEAVVCFTAVPLAHLPRLRKFQTHRARWDFEPYGLCIHKDWLQHLGARPVIYGGELTWLELSEQDRPFFQFTADPNSPSARDWTVEEEWRHRGDLDLTSLPPEKGLLFVPRYQDAARLSGSSPWPITLWPDTDNIPH